MNIETKLTQLVNSRSISKEIIYLRYTNIIGNNIKYEKITKKEMLQQILNFYTEDYNNIVSLCTYKELMLLKEILENNNNLFFEFNYKTYWFSNDKLFARKCLFFKMLINSDFNNLLIFDELVEPIKNALASLNKEELLNKEKIIIPILGFLKTVQGIYIDEFPLKLANAVGFNDVKSLIKYLKNDRLFNFYCKFKGKKIIFEEFNTANEVIKIRSKLSYPFPDEYDLTKYANIFYYNYDINNKKIIELKNNIKNIEFFSYNVFECFLAYLNFGCTGSEIVGILIEEFPYYADKFKEDQHEIIDFASELPCAVLNGFSENEYLEYVSLNNDKRFTYNNNANLSKDDVNKFYKVMYAYLDYTNKRYNINPKINTNNNNLNNASHDDIIKLLDCLWKNIDLLAFELTKTNKYNLNDEEIKIANDFKKSKRGHYLILAYEKGFTLFIDEKYAYKVKGLIEPINNVIRRDLPVFVITTLLEFKGQIIYDGFIFPYNINFPANVINGMVANVANSNIISSFDEIERKDKKWKK